MFCYLAFLFIFISSNNAETSELPIPKFEAFQPSGIRVTLPNMDGITEFFLWGNINVPLEGKDLGDIQLSTYDPVDGVWLIEDMDIKLKPGDTIYYTFFVTVNGVVQRLERQQYTIKEVVDRPTTHKPTTATTPTTTTTTPTPTTTKKIVKKGCLDETIYIKISEEKTIVVQLDKYGKEINMIENIDCSKSLTLDLDKGEVKFS